MRPSYFSVGRRSRHRYARPTGRGVRHAVRCRPCRAASRRRGLARTPRTARALRLARPRSDRQPSGLHRPRCQSQVPSGGDAPLRRGDDRAVALGRNHSLVGAAGAPPRPGRARSSAASGRLPSCGVSPIRRIAVPQVLHRAVDSRQGVGIEDAVRGREHRTQLARAVLPCRYPAAPTPYPAVVGNARAPTVWWGLVAGFPLPTTRRPSARRRPRTAAPCKWPIRSRCRPPAFVLPESAALVQASRCRRVGTGGRRGLEPGRSRFRDSMGRPAVCGAADGPFRQPKLTWTSRCVGPGVAPVSSRPRWDVAATTPVPLRGSLTASRRPVAGPLGADATIRRQVCPRWTGRSTTRPPHGPTLPGRPGALAGP